MYIKPQAILSFILLVFSSCSPSLSGQATIASSSAQNFVNPESAPFGATGNGVTDDAAAIRSADAYAAEVGLPLYFPHQYLINSPISPHTKWTGIAGESKIIIGSQFTYDSFNGSPLQGAIYNPNFSTTFSNPDTVDIENLTFINNAPADANHQRETLMLSNAQNVILKNVNFQSSGSDGLTDLDIYGPVQHGSFSQLTFIQNTGATTGGNLWILGLGATSSDVTNDLNFSDLTLTHNSGDESIAVAAAAAPVDNITIDHFSITEMGAPVTPLSVFGTATDSNGIQTVNNVTLSHFTVTTNNTQYFGMRIGLGGSIQTATNNIHISNFSFLSTASVSTMTSALNVDATNVSIDQGVFSNTAQSVCGGNPCYIANAVLGSGSDNSTIHVTHSSFSGYFYNAINTVGSASNNNINFGTLGNGIANTFIVDANQITAISPIVAGSDGSYTITNNAMTVPGSLGCGNAAVLAQGGAVNVFLSCNTITLDNPCHYAVNNTTTGTVSMSFDTITGVGGEVNGTIASFSDVNVSNLSQ